MKNIRRAGYSLVEVLACIALCGALFPAASKAYTSITRLHAAQSAALDRVVAFNDLEREFRAAVARAEAVEASVGTFKTADSTVVLRMPGGAYTVFTVDAQAQARRVEIAPARGGWETRTVPYALPRWRFRFVAVEGGVELRAKPIAEAWSNSKAVPAPVKVIAALREGGA